MAVQITSANANAINQGVRMVVHTSGGEAYAVLRDLTDDAIEVWKDVDGTPAEQDSGNRPSNANYRAPSCAIDSSDIIHIAYYSVDGKNSALRYVTFNTSTDTYSGDTQIQDVGDDDPSNPWTNIVVDSNSIPHIMWADIITSMGTDYHSVFYTNKIGGSWNTAIEVEGGSSQKACIWSSLCINEDNIPEISYINVTDADLGAAVGDANNPTGFTLHDPDTTISTSGGSSSIVVDSNGDTWIGYKDSSNNVYLVQHQDADAWTTWQTPITNSNTEGGTGISLAVDGTDIYLFYEDDNDDIVYDKYNGTSWDGETVVETGTYLYPRAKWSQYHNNDGGTQIDYLFEDATGTVDIWWNKIDLAAPERVWRARQIVQKSVQPKLIA